MSSAGMNLAWIHAFAFHSQLFGIITLEGYRVKLKKINEDWNFGPLFLTSKTTSL
jgi:hypothetical protein